LALWKIIPLIALDPPSTLPRLCDSRRAPRNGSGSDS
jgi:hypothetical protein